MSRSAYGKIQTAQSSHRAENGSP